MFSNEYEMKKCLHLLLQTQKAISQIIYKHLKKLLIPFRLISSEE